MAETLRNPDTPGRGFTHYSPKLSTRRARWTLLAGIGAAAAAALLAAGQNGDPEMQLEAAIYNETVRGDLKGAIGQYRALAAQSGAPRPVAARALLHLGQCLQKLGQSREAQGAYGRIVREYSDQRDIAAMAQAQAAPRSESGPRNLNFQQGVAGKAPPGWLVNGDYAAEVRRSGCRVGIGCALVLAPANATMHVGNLMQSFTAAPYKGKTVRLRAWLRLDASGPEDRAQMWLRVDRANWPLGFLDNMDDRPVRSEDWTRCEITTRVYEDATMINLGVMSIGGGRVWVDDVSFEVI